MPRIAIRQIVVFTNTIAAMLLVTATAVSFEVQPEVDPAATSRLKQDVEFLADDSMRGRGIGTDGLNVAANYIRMEFSRAGLDVTQVEGGAYQKFTMVTGTELGEENSMVFTGPETDGAEQKIELEYDKAIRSCSFGNSGEFNNELVFAGYGIKSTEPKYDDFEGQDLKDKVLIMMRRTPQQKPRGPFSGRRGAQFGSLTSKLNNAIKAGAAAVIFVNDPYTVRNASVRAEARRKLAASRVKRAEDEVTEAGDDEEKKKTAQAQVDLLKSRLETATKLAERKDHDDLMTFGYGGNADEDRIPVFHARNDAIDKLLQASIGKSLSDLEKQIDEDLKPATVSLTGWNAKGVASVERIDTEVKNVIGVLEGEGEFADETVVIGAHYDHVGMGRTGSLSGGPPEIHNGADDNASGTASLIELARQIQAKGIKPKRRLVFMAFTAEESGLIGSKKYCELPIFPLEKTVAMFNMDMVGRLTGNRLTIFGSGTAKGWETKVANLGLKYQFDLNMQPEGLGPSDQASFYRKEIPVLHFFTGVHPNYHRPSDDPNLVNYIGMTRIIDCVEDIVMETTQSESRPEYLEVKTRANISDTASRPFLGIIPDLTSDAEGVRVANVQADSPAEKSGFKTGDIVTEFAGQKITDMAELSDALREQKPNLEVNATLKRGEEDVNVKVRLAEPN